jgi:hypothetical protein
MVVRWIKWIGLAAGLVLVIACFITWVHFTSQNISVTGVDPAGTPFGKPGSLHFIFTFFFLLFTLIPKIWAKSFNLGVTALNLAWAIRNFIIVTTCSGGECPEKELGIILVLLASVLMLMAALFPDVRQNGELKKT